VLPHHFSLPLLRPPRSTLVPYTTLFRSPLENALPPHRLLEGNRCNADLNPVRPWHALPDSRAGPTKSRGKRIPRVLRETNTAPSSEEHTSELQSRSDLVCRLLLEKKKKY